MVKRLRAPLVIVVVLAVGSLLGALMVGNRFAALVTDSHNAATPALLSGTYLGWSTSTDSRLLLYGRGCRANAEDDSVVSLLLSGANQQILLPKQAVTSLDLDFGAAGFHPVLLVDLTGGESWHFDRAVLRCRSGKEFAASLGTVSVLAVRQSAAAVTLEANAQYASDQLFAELLIHNHSGGTLRLSSVQYAPLARATGRVQAAAGSYAQLSLWRSLIYDPRLAPLDAATLSPWDAAFQHPDDARRLLPRSTDAIGMEVASGEIAVIYLELSSLQPNRYIEPVLVYPVVEIVTGRGSQQLAAQEPLFTWSPAR